MRVVEAEHVVEERDQDVLVLLGSEDPLEHEVGLGVGEGRAIHAAGARRATALAGYRIHLGKHRLREK
jgi:hypothetical protein